MAQKLNLHDFFWTPIWLAMIFAQLGRLERKLHLVAGDEIGGNESFGLIAGPTSNRDARHTVSGDELYLSNNT
jgi:hypothetical protein